MPTRIVLAAGATLRVHEETEDVVNGLVGISPASPDLVCIRAAGHADPGASEGKIICVRPSHVLYFTTA